MLIRLLCIIYLFLASICAQASISQQSAFDVELIQQTWPDLYRIGDARYSKYGFKLYDAELWSSDQDQPQLSNKETYAFHVKYKRNIKKPTLLKHTNKQWRRLATPGDLANQWLAQLDVIWPDIKTGDILSCIVEPEAKTLFFLNDNYIGEVRDAQFGLAFLNIWLNEKSAFKKQRQQLLGLRDE